MSKGLTSDQKNRISLDEVKTRILLTITFDDSLGIEPIQVLENDTLGGIEFGGITYLSAMIKRGMIESQMEGGKQQVEITLSNINKDYTTLIASNGDILTNSLCKIEEIIYIPPRHDQMYKEGSTDFILLEDGGYLLLENDSIIGDKVNIFEGYINNVSLNQTTCKFNVERILGGYSTQSPNSTFDISCQWRFKDKRCGYNGVTYTTCDKTLTSCQVRSNSTRFGGYPSIPQEMVIRS